jgi:hypothetical protein
VAILFLSSAKILAPTNKQKNQVQFFGCECLAAKLNSGENFKRTKSKKWQKQRARSKAEALKFRRLERKRNSGAEQSYFERTLKDTFIQCTQPNICLT